MMLTSSDIFMKVCRQFGMCLMLAFCTFIFVIKSQKWYLIDEKNSKPPSSVHNGKFSFQSIDNFDCTLSILLLRCICIWIHLSGLSVVECYVACHNGVYAYLHWNVMHSYICTVLPPWKRIWKTRFLFKPLLNHDTETHTHKMYKCRKVNGIQSVCTRFNYVVRSVFFCVAVAFFWSNSLHASAIHELSYTWTKWATQLTTQPANKAKRRHSSTNEEE